MNKCRPVANVKLIIKLVFRNQKRNLHNASAAQIISKIKIIDQREFVPNGTGTSNDMIIEPLAKEIVKTRISHLLCLEKIISQKTSKKCLQVAVKIYKL